MRLGNLLYMWLWAYQGQLAGAERRCLANKSTLPWLPVFPEAHQRLVLLRDEVRFTDRRVQPWRNEVELDARYDPPHLEAFCREFLLPGVGNAAAPADRLVVNVRRGDYYAPEHVDEFGFDVVSFVRAAVDEAISGGGAPASIRIVSDDTGWCDDHLGFLKGIAPVSFGATNDPLSDLRELAQARRLILSNSTFAYWGGYIGDVIAGERQVLAPAFWGRSEPGSTRHLRPEWTAVDAGA
ncbi:hypothetical protein ASG76_00920 [Nocardioides sp. Soil774]|nr:hypothetical protein ASG76_00920 [Nocardioides sp. Soil774]